MGLTFPCFEHSDYDFALVYAFSFTSLDPRVLLRKIRQMGR